MPRLPVSVPDEAAELRAGFEAVRAELGAPAQFPPDVLAEAQDAARAPAVPARDATGIPLVTIDPPGSRDLDQALHIARRSSGYRVTYAIADVAAFVRPGGRVDAEAWARGVTLYSPDRRTPLHPPALSEDAASLLPGQERPAVVWTVDLDPDGATRSVDVRRARVRSRVQLDYATVQRALDAGSAEEPLALLAEVGALREERERERGATHLPIPAQEVERAPGGGWTVAYRAPLPVEGFNAQISLLTGMAAADLMLGGPAGILRTVPAPDERAQARLRRAAEALGAPWPSGVPYPEWVRGLDGRLPAHAALLRQATGLARGAGYAAWVGEPPAERRHGPLAAEYAHVTAPLRRLADRYAAECALAACAETEPPAWAIDRLADLPEAMREADRRASALERGVVDLVEAWLLEGRVGEAFEAAVIDTDERGGVVQLLDPAVRARIAGRDLPLGETVRARLASVDVGRREVVFEPAEAGPPG